MKAIANAIRFFIYSNLFIACCVVAYTAKTSQLLYGNNGNVHVNGIVFSITLFFYCFYRVNKKRFITTEEGKEGRNRWMGSHTTMYVFLLAISSISLLIQLFYMPLRAWLVFIPVGLLGIGYTFPIIRTKDGWKRLRDISWFKTVWIAFAFSWLTTFLPVVFMEPVSSLLKPGVIFIFCRSFLFLFALCIPFDIRDLSFDRLKEVYTLPVSVGVKTSIYIAISMLLIFISLICIQFLYYKLDFTYAIALFSSATLTIILVLFANPKRPPLFFPFLYDGSMLIQWILVVIFANT